MTHRIKAIAKPVAVAVSMAVAVVAMPSQSFAGAYGVGSAPAALTENGRSDITTVGHRNRGYYGHRRHYKHRRHNNNAGAAVAAGIIGLAIGAAIAGSAQQPRRHYRAQPVQRAYHHAPRPYSGAWYRYCANKYRSFDAASGTYLSYSGVRRVCR